MYRIHGYYTIGRCKDCGQPCLVYVTKVDEQGNEWGNPIFCFERVIDADEAIEGLQSQLVDLMKRFRILETKEEEKAKIEVPEIFKDAFKEE